MEDIVANILKDLLILLVTLVVQFFLTSYVIALIPIDYLQAVSSGHQNILANLTTTEVSLISNSTIEFNVLLPLITHILTLMSIIFLILDIKCYLKAKQSKHSLN
jgi:hypothetical protein